jgi:hypothetical protein
VRKRTLLYTETHTSCVSTRILIWIHLRCVPVLSNLPFRGDWLVGSVAARIERCIADIPVRPPGWPTLCAFVSRISAPSRCLFRDERAGLGSSVLSCVFRFLVWRPLSEAGAFSTHSSPWMPRPAVSGCGVSVGSLPAFVGTAFRGGPPIQPPAPLSSRPKSRAFAPRKRSPRSGGISLRSTPLAHSARVRVFSTFPGSLEM